MIVVSFQEGQEGFNIARSAVGRGNHKGLTDGRIIVGGAEDVIPIRIVGIDRISIRC
jgi:hypothetical protein